MEPLLVALLDEARTAGFRKMLDHLQFATDDPISTNWYSSEITHLHSCIHDAQKPQFLGEVCISECTDDVYNNTIGCMNPRLESGV